VVVKVAVETTRLRWRQAWRVIASRYPPIALFERVSDNPAVWDVLIELEQATNPRVRDEAGEIALVPPERRVSGPNASWVMAPFTHINRNGSRFSDGSYGVYYAARSLQTAIRKPAITSRALPRIRTIRRAARTCACCLADVSATLHDVSKLDERRSAGFFIRKIMRTAARSRRTCASRAATASSIRACGTRRFVHRGVLAGCRLAFRCRNGICNTNGTGALQPLVRL
jgi:hypothetical protein